LCNLAKLPGNAWLAYIFLKLPASQMNQRSEQSASCAFPLPGFMIDSSRLINLLWQLIIKDVHGVFSCRKISLIKNLSLLGTKPHIRFLLTTRLSRPPYRYRRL